MENVSTESKKMKINVLDMAYIALGAALITVCSWISIPAAVPFTLQTFAIFAVLGILGGKRGTISILVYVLLGAVGVPVFANFKGGVSALIGTTGGYILGFILTALIYWLITKLLSEKLPFMIIAMVLGLIACYFFGTAWFIKVYTGKNGAITVAKALQWCVIPFIPFDAAKMALAIVVSKSVKRFVK